MNTQTIIELVKKHHSFFATNKTKDLAFRREQLRKLRGLIVDHEQELFDALRGDLDKPAFESYVGETGFVIKEIDFALKHLAGWAKPERVRTPLIHFPGSSAIYREPCGVALIIGPWNFPVQLMLVPLISAISAGNCAVLKPSISALRTSHLIARLIRDTFDQCFISVVEGGAETTQALLGEKFDYIFFTGGPAVGRIVMTAAARHLTPVTLELGGKNPCIVDQDVDLDSAARRIVWGKFFNSGQSCVAPDYLLVNRNVKKALIERIKRSIRDFYGKDPSQSQDYGRIIDTSHYDRITGLLSCGRVLLGGTGDRTTRYMAPTLLDDIQGNEPIMQEEIFGPILPIIAYDKLSQAIAFVNERPRPLALYFFSRSKRVQEQVLHETSAGGGCINDVVIHQTSAYLPFGGVDESGIGACHGKAGFDTFSHQRSVIKRGFSFDSSLRYPPYKNRLAWLRRFF